MRTPKNISKFEHKAAISLYKKTLQMPDGPIEITCAEVDGSKEGREWIAFRELCGVLGLNYSGQLQKFASYRRRFVCLIHTGDDTWEQRNRIFIVKKMIPKFLEELHLGKIKAELRPRILALKEQTIEHMDKIYNKGHTVEPPKQSKEIVVVGEKGEEKLPAASEFDDIKDDPGFRVIVQLQDQTRSLYAANVRSERKIQQLEIRATQGEERIERAEAKAIEAVETVHRVINKEMNNVPPGFLSQEDIRRRYFRGVSKAVMVQYLRSVKHVEHLMLGGSDATLANAVPVFEDKGLAERYDDFIKTSVFLNETDKWLKFRHPSVDENFAFVKSKLSLAARQKIDARINDCQSNIMQIKPASEGPQQRSLES